MEPTQQSNALTPYFSVAMNQLNENTQRDDFQGSGIDLVQGSYVAMTTLVQNSCTASNDIIYQLMIPILQRLEGTLNLNNMSIDKANHLQDLLCGLL